MLYKSADGSERTARADLSIICDGMYSSLRSKLSTPRIRCTKLRALSESAAHQSRSVPHACPRLSEMPWLNSSASIAVICSEGGWHQQKAGDTSLMA